MNLPVDFRDESQLRSAFSYLTRIGVAPKFGTLPIAYYQQDQCRALDILETTQAEKVRCRQGNIELFERGAWRKFATVQDLVHAVHVAFWQDNQ